jgi:autotransporter-associated beta strand protein
MQQWMVGVVAALALIAAGPAWAAPYTWTPTAAGTYNWDNSGPQNNWGSGFPNVIDDVANLNINLAGAETVNLNQAITVGTINLGDNASGYNAMTIAPNGGSLILDVGSGSATIGKATAGNNVKDVISANIQLNDNLTISNATTVGNVITLELSGAISESGGAKGITFPGVGKTFLSGTGNTFTGPVTVQNGTLFYNTLGNGGASSSLGAGSPTINLGSGANTVQLLHNSASADTNNATINLTGSGATVTIGNDWFGQSGGVSGGAITFNGNFNNSTGANTLQINGSGTGDITFNGSILDTGSGVTAVKVIGQNIYTFNSATNTYTGKTTLQGQAGNPTLRFTKLADAGVASSFGAPTGANATIDMGVSNGGLQYIGTTDSTSNRKINLIGNGGGYTIGIGSAAPNGKTLTLNGDIQSSFTANNSTLNFTRGGSMTGKIVVNGLLADSASKTLSVYLDDNNSTDFVTLTGTNTFTGTTTLFRNSYLTISSIKNLGQASALGAPTNVVNGTIQFGQAGTSTLRYIGTGDTTDRVIDLKSDNAGRGGKLEQAGTGLLTFTSASTNSGTANALLTLQGSTAGIGEISGNLSDSSTRTLSLTKDGTGTWVLSGNNTYTGTTYINSGILRLSSANALGGGNLAFRGAQSYVSSGVLELGAGDFTRSLGSGAGQVKWDATTSSGGFSAYGASRIVNLGGSGAQVTVGVSGFYDSWNSGTAGRVPIIFGSTGSDAQLDFQNPINFNGRQIIIQVDDNPNTISDVTVLSGQLSNGGFTKTGAGTLILTAANTFSGANAGGLNIEGGVVRLAHATALPATSTLNLVGGVAELTAQSGDFTRALGTSGNKVTWRYVKTNGGSWIYGSGGFSAYGGDRYVNIGGAGATLIWNTADFVQTGNALIFGSSTADSQIEFKNPIDLAGAVRTIQVDDNTNSTADQALLSGALSNGGLTKTGTGKLVLGVNETYAGATTVSNGTLVVNGTLASSGITVNPLGTLGGTGTTTVAVSLDAGGTVAPGDNGTGTLTVGSLASPGGGVLRYSVQSGTCGKLVVNGALDVSTMQLVVTGTAPASKVVLAQGTSVTGPFQNVDVSGVTGGQVEVTYTATQVLFGPPPAGTVILLR